MIPKKRLVFISEYLGENLNSTSYYWTKIIKFLSPDYEILIICPNTKDNLNYLKSQNYRNLQYESSSFSKFNLFSRLIAYIKMSFAFYKVTKNEINKSDILISGTNSIFNMIFLSIIKRKLNIPWLFFGYDIFPENLVVAKAISQYNPFYKLVSIMFSFLYRLPNDIVAVGRDMSDLLNKKVKGLTRVHYIPNWADHTDIKLFPKKDSKIIRELKWDDEFTIFQFFGNFGVFQDIYCLIDAIKLSKAQNAKFLFVGNGSEAFRISKIINNLNDKRIHFYGACDMSKKNHALNACDVAFVTLKKGMRGLAVPSKSYFSLAANKPIIVVADEGSELRRLVDEYPIGWGCNSGDPQALAELIDDLSFNKDNILKMKPRHSLTNYFSESNSLNSIKNLILNYS